MSRNYTLRFDNIKVGDVVVFEQYLEGVCSLSGRGTVTRVTPQQFKFTYERGDKVFESTNNKEDGTRRGWHGQQVYFLDTPESKAEYEALQEQRRADDKEYERKKNAAEAMNEQLKAAGLSRVRVHGYGSFHIDTFTNEEETQRVIDALIAAGIKL